jgi:hypothetical protein
MNCKEYLTSYGHALRNASRVEERLLMEQCRSEKITSVLSDMPRGGGALKDDAWAGVIDMKEMYKEELRLCFVRQKEVEHFISLVSGETHRLILRLRYIDLMKWEDIAVMADYGLRQVLRLHGSALAEARKTYEIWGLLL